MRTLGSRLETRRVSLSGLHHVATASVYSPVVATPHLSLPLSAAGPRLRGAPPLLGRRGSGQSNKGAAAPATGAALRVRSAGALRRAGRRPARSSSWAQPARGPHVHLVPLLQVCEILSGRISAVSGRRSALKDWVAAKRSGLAFCTRALHERSCAKCRCRCRPARSSPWAQPARGPQVHLVPLLQDLRNIDRQKRCRLC